MEISFVNVALAGGAAMAVIPVILHLILRQRPRHEMFPALRLIRLRHRANLRKLRIRHWLLMVLRMLLIALMAVALARPSIHGASFIPDQQAPVAAALVFDTSLSMEYRERDRMRLQEAQDIALDLLKDFPDGSEVLVFDSADPGVRSFRDVASARQRIESLRLRPMARSVNQAIIEACRELKESDPTRKEIYIFSDAMAGSFAIDTAGDVRTAIASVREQPAVYVLNVSVRETKNAFISKVTPSAEVIPANSDLIVRVEVQDAGLGERVLLELLEGDQPRGSQELLLSKVAVARHEFYLPRLAPGAGAEGKNAPGPKDEPVRNVRQWRVVLRGGGGLAFDDVRYLTVEVRPVTRVLLVSDVERDAARLRDALAPEEVIEKQQARYQCDWIAASRLPSKGLAGYAVVVLVNVESLSADTWQKLESFVLGGGGLGVFLGPRADADSYNQQAAQALLPVRLLAVRAPPQPVTFQAPDERHAVVRKLHEHDRDAIGQITVHRYWQTEPSGEHARRVIDFTDGAVALAEQTPGPSAHDRTTAGTQPGRVLVWTTSASPGPWPNRWNDFPQSSLQFVVLADCWAQHLAGLAEQQLNYRVGDNVVLHPDRDQRFGPYWLQTPDSAQPTRGSGDPKAGTVVVAAPEALGNYRVTFGQGEQAFEKGFSVNADRSESLLDPMSPSELAAVVGDNFAVARTLDELREAREDVRIGRELFPWIMLLIVVLFAAEHLLANRFYKSTGSGESKQPNRPRQSESKPEQLVASEK